MSFDSKTVRPYTAMVDTDHLEVHARNLFTYSTTRRIVADESALQLRIKPTTKECHVQIIYSAEGKAYLKTYAHTEFPLVNVVANGFNRVIEANAPQPTTLLYTLETVSLNVPGTLRGDDAIGSSGNPNQQAGGSSNGRLETIVTPGNELLVEIQNVAGVARYLGLIINFYEK